MKKYLIIFQQTPFASSDSLEGLELCLALSAFNQAVSLLFMGESVLQLLDNKKTEFTAHKDFTKTFAGLDLFDIDQVYSEQAAMEKYKLDAETLNITPAPLTRQQIAALITQHDVILTI
jgi:tRNA 2-thiouridine synthesizing protein C